MKELPYYYNVCLQANINKNYVINGGDTITRSS